MSGSSLRGLVRSAFVDRVERDHHEPDALFRRRRIVVAVTLVLGSALLGVSLSVKPGDPMFYPLTAAVAAVWMAGSLASGRLHLGRISFRDKLRRPIATPIVTGLLVGGVFIAGALIVQHIPLLRAQVDAVLDHARYGSLTLVTLIALLNGVAEEVFFRGALFAAIGRKHPVLISTIVYALATAATLNVMLVFSAVLLGAVLGLQRRASGGILAPALTHLTWSLAMIFVMPPMLGSGWITAA